MADSAPALRQMTFTMSKPLTGASIANVIDRISPSLFQAVFEFGSPQPHRLRLLNL